MMESNKKGALDILMMVFGLMIIGLIVLYFLSGEELVKISALSAFFVILIITIIYAYFHFTSAKNKLKKLIKQFESSSSGSSLGDLKMSYVDIYNSYMKISEEDKQNFYSRVSKMRESLEEQLRAEKKVEILLDEASKGSIGIQRKKYGKLQENLNKLPVKDQQKYFPQVTHLKERLERGKK